MDAILRIMYADKIEDYDLTVQEEPVCAGDFRAEQSGSGWVYSTHTASGPLKPDDIIVIDPAARMAALVIERVNGIHLIAGLIDGLTIGRKEGNAIVLKDRLVSGVHCRLEQNGAEWYLRDCGSTNGTYVNNRRIVRAKINPGDEIKLGRYRFRMGSGLHLENADHRTQFCTEVRQPDAMDVLEIKPYPWFSRAPRMLSELPELTVKIEDAPAIGEKPTMGIGGIMLNPAMMALSMGNQALRFGLGKKKYNKLEKRRQEVYGAYLAEIEASLQSHAEAQRQQEETLHPSTVQCMTRAEGPALNLWERQPGDGDFLTLRLGLGTVPAKAKVEVPLHRLQLYEDELAKMPEQIAEKYKNIGDMPICCDLMRGGSCGIIGPQSCTEAMAQSMAAQIAALHSCDEVKLVVVPAGEERPWAWMRWLPHCCNDERTIRYVVSGDGANDVLEHLNEVARARMSDSENGMRPRHHLPHYVFLVADPDVLKNSAVEKLLTMNQPALGFSGIFLGSSLSDFPNTIAQVLELQGTAAQMQMKLHNSGDITRLSGEECNITAEVYEQFARAMAPIRLPVKSKHRMLPRSVTFLQGWHIDDPAQWDPGALWQRGCCYKSMAVPVGIRANGEPFLFDIHEKAHGPHGLVAGMTGSGKSEMIQSWILSMVMQFSPQDAAFVLIDFKGTGLILPFLNLPHLAGTISDLDVNVSRNLIALNSELARRKMLFDQAGVNKISDYLKLRDAGKVSEPMPYLFVVIDEYAEFRAKFPDFTGQINSLFRTGRSMGVHIILLTQNPSGVVSGESESNVRFRWCLKVASAAASKEVLGGHDDAAYVTNPGRAYVRVGSDEIFEPVQSFYSGAPYLPGRRQRDEDDFEIAHVAFNGAETVFRPARTAEKSNVTEIAAMVDRIRAYTTEQEIPDARPIWQNRMPAELMLPDLLAQEPDHDDGDLLPVVGMLDDPRNQVQRPMRLPLSTDGHIAVIGAPGSGKTVFLQTLAASLCSQYTPDEVNLYIMDFGGWSLGMFRDYPHVRAVANDNEEDKIQRLVQLLEQELHQRKEAFSKAGAGNLKTYRTVTGEKLPYLVLLLDNFAPVYQLYPKLDEFFIRLGREGGNYGIYLVTTAGSTMALGYKLNQTIKTTIALQMTDPSEYSSVVGRTEGLLPEKVPGRGLIRENYIMEFQTAMPFCPDEKGFYITQVRQLGEELTARYGKRKEEAPLTMPDTIAYGSVTAKNGGWVLGLDASALTPVEVSLQKPHHLLISGTEGSGKTTMLKMLGRQILDRQGKLAVFSDPGAWDEFGDDVYRMTTGAEADVFLEKLAALLGERKGRLTADPNTTLEPMGILIDGYKRFYEEISELSANRLKALVMAGAGLGVHLIAADREARITMMVQYREPVTMLLSKGPSVMLGGKALDHMGIASQLAPTEKNVPLKPQEGWFQSADGVVRFKVMDCK